MEKEKRELMGAGELRRKAKERLKEKPALPEKLSELETQELIQELRVHQIELEMQNEELHRTQAVVEESRAKYSDLYDFAPVGYLTLNRQGIILEANLTACSKLGKERSLLINIKNLFTNFIIKKKGKDLFYQHLGKVFEAKSLETCELELKGKDNTKFYAQLQSTVVKDNLSQCRTAIIDITERKELEEELKKAVKDWDNIFNAISDFVLILDKDFTIIKANFSFAESLNLKPEDMIGKKCYEVLHKTKKTWPDCPFEMSKKDKLPHRQEVNDPNIGIPLLVSASPIFDEKKEVSGAVCIARDISKMKSLEREIKKQK